MVARLFLGSDPLSRLRDDMDRLFDRALADIPTGLAGLVSPATFPAVNVWEDGNNVYAEAELPGVSMKDVEVSVVGNELTLKGERKGGASEGITYHRRERGAGAFSRVFHLPVDIEADRVEATMRDGVLLVTMPKAAAAKPRKVEVRALTS